MNAPSNVIRMVANRLGFNRNLSSMFPGYFEAVKHNHYADFGYPTALDFTLLYAMYSRNGLARAAINKTILKTWQDAPFILEKQRDSGEEIKETTVEKDIRERFSDLRLWAKFAEADRRSLVGAYSGLILRLGDGKAFNEPVDRVGGGLEGLVEVIPAWEGQLSVASWDTDERSPDYGHPTMYQFQESAVGSNKQPRNFPLHPDRVIIWSADGTVNGTSALEPGYNDLLTMEKVSGAGGEGFWKNAKSAPVLSVDKEAKIADMARMMGIKETEIADKINEQVADYNSGFDKMLMLQGITADTLSITLPSPEHFFDIALQSFAASFNIPNKILVGMQTGERASTEDAHEWAQTNMARRNDVAIPNILIFVNRLEQFGILPEKDWWVEWTDLTETSMSEKIDRANKMAEVNQKMKDTGEFVFTSEEIRYAVGYEPLSDEDKFRDTDADEDKEAAGGLPDEPDPAATDPKEEEE